MKTTGKSNDITREADNLLGNQTRLNVPLITSAKKRELDLAFSAVSLLDGQSFSLFELPSLKAALHQLHPAYNPPDRHAIAGPLLEQTFAQVKEKVDTLINNQQLLNIITDESTDINMIRIANISLHTTFGSIFYVSEDVGSVSMTSVNSANWLDRHIRIMTNDNLDRVNSIATDTCPTMFAMWKELQVDPLDVKLIVESSSVQALSLRPLRFAWNSTPYQRPPYTR
jgi:hypothetical protein